MKRLIVIDGNSIMFRAYYATSFGETIMHTRSGLFTNSVYGVANMMEHLKATYEYSHIFVAFDKGKKTFRHQAYADYKGGRAPTPPELLMQIPYVRDYFTAMGITWAESDDFEADDLVGSVAVEYGKDFDEVMIISGDRDLLQLAKGNIHVYLTKKGITELEMYSEENFRELMGIDVSQMTSYKAMIGDSSDNLAGITGIGPKTAVKLLNTYESVEEVIAHKDELSAKLKENIEHDGARALTVKELATIVTNVPLDYTLADLEEKPNYQALRDLYEKLEFNKLLKKLQKEVFSNEEITSVEAVEVKSQWDNLYLNDLDKFNTCLKDVDDVYLELEIAGASYHKDPILGMGIVINNDAFFFDKEHIDQALIDFLKGKKVNTIDIKKDIVALNRLGISFEEFIFDFILAAYILDPSYGDLDIKSIYDKLFDNDLVFIEDVYQKKTTYQIPEKDIYINYCLKKAYLLKEGKPAIEKRLKDLSQLDLLYNIEIPLAITLAHVELAGFKVDKTRLFEIGDIFKEKIDLLEKEIYELAGEEFNISSPKQLGVILFEKLNLPTAKKNKTGYTTSADVLEKLSSMHPLPEKVLEYRRYAKLYNTYVIGLNEEIGVDGKVYTTFKQALTLTGRLSSVEPNIQNIPIRTSDGRLIRSAFVPSDKDGLIISADYSQIELRILAHLSGCQKMLAMFNEGIDLHAATAASIFKKSLEDVSKDERRIAKTVNFGIVYGMSAWGLSEELGISPSQAANFINAYFDLFPEIDEYLNKVVADTRSNHYTTTLYGRRRYISDINSSNTYLRQFAERTAKNAPIQGTAADIIKLAMIEVDKKIRGMGLESRMVAQVHDELVIDAKADEKELIEKILKNTMENIVNLDVLLKAEISEGSNWDLK